MFRDSLQPGRAHHRVIRRTHRWRSRITGSNHERIPVLRGLCERQRRRRAELVAQCIETAAIRVANGGRRAPGSTSRHSPGRPCQKWAFVEYFLPGYPSSSLQSHLRHRSRACRIGWKRSQDIRQVTRPSTRIGHGEPPDDSTIRCSRQAAPENAREHPYFSTARSPARSRRFSRSLPPAPDIHWLVCGSLRGAKCTIETKTSSGCLPQDHRLERRVEKPRDEVLIRKPMKLENSALGKLASSGRRRGDEPRPA